MKFSLPLKLVNSTNVREHWSKRARRAKEQRGLAKMFTANSWTMLQQIQHFGTYEVKITRIGKRLMDDDGVQASAKNVRDGIADALQVDDGDLGLIRFSYAQRLGKSYAVEIEII